MKTSIVGALVASAFAVPALAQSSVAIYGIADAGVMKTSGEKTKIVSGIADGSRLGFRGTEELGGGWKAVFNLRYSPPLLSAPGLPGASRLPVTPGPAPWNWGR